MASVFGRFASRIIGPWWHPRHTSPDDATGKSSRIPAGLDFIFSKYMIVMLLTAIILNRIQHIVAPLRSATPLQRSRAPVSTDPRHPLPQRGVLRRLLHTLFYRLHRLFLPLDLESTRSRLLISLPALLLLFRSLALLSITLLQVYGQYPSPVSSSRWRSLRALGKWTVRKDTPEIMWTTFYSVCVGMVTSYFIVSLEGSIGRPPSFNLIRYAASLQAYASPEMYINVKDASGFVMRPPANVVFILFIPLLQMLILQLMQVKKSWSTQHLIPTTICGLMIQAHFIYVASINIHAYPSSSFGSSIMELLFIALIGLTYLLDLITRILLSPTPTLAPSSWSSRNLISSEDEYSTAIIKLAVSCLEATNFVGLANELAPIDGSGAKHARRRGRKEEVRQGEVQLGKSGVRAIIPANTSASRTLRVGHAQMQDHTASEPATGFYHEIKRVGPSRDGAVRSTSLGGDVFGYWGEGLHRPEVRRLGSLGWRYIFGLGLWMWRGWKNWWRRAFRGEYNPGHVHRLQVPDSPLQQLTRTIVTVTTDLEEDLDDPDYVQTGDDDLDGSESDHSSDGEHDDNDGFDDDNSDESPSPAEDAGALIADIAPQDASLLLAHFQQSWLTRSQYNDPNMDNISGTRRRGGDDDDSRRNCVVCTVEPRVVICWPCRCLALCDDCRGSLAVRSSASKHHCPCCRQSVEGYSRIFIP